MAHPVFTAPTSSSCPWIRVIIYNPDGSIQIVKLREGVSTPSGSQQVPFQERVVEKR